MRATVVRQVARPAAPSERAADRLLLHALRRGVVPLHVGDLLALGLCLGRGLRLDDGGREAEQQAGENGGAQDLFRHVELSIFCPGGSCSPGGGDCSAILVATSPPAYGSVRERQMEKL